MKGTFGAFVTVPSPRIPLFTRRVRTASRPEEREESGATSAAVEQTVESVDPVASEGPSYAALLDHVLGCAAPDRGTSIVVAAADQTERDDDIVTGLELAARVRGLRVSVARLSLPSSGNSLTLALDSGTEPGDPRGEESPAPVRSETQHPNGRALSADPRHWLTNARDDCDLVIVEGPSLSSSMQAAMLARHCDGLLISAESESTTKADLRAAAEKARAAGCHVIAVVLRKRRQWLPRWLRGF